MKNKRHSELIYELNRLRKQYNHYLTSIIISKNFLRTIYIDPHEIYNIDKYKAELEDSGFMVNLIRKKIKKIKNEIYKTQKEYSINHANQQPSINLTTDEGSETNS